jgi:peptidoglycan-N-acetylglucosamine deacetylase
MVSEGPYRPGNPRRLVTLTFDDGPFLETTPKVLRLLASEKIHATFFVVGQYLDGEDKRTRVTRELLRRIAREGHLIGNHTHDHARLTMRTHTNVLEQIDEGAASIELTTGQRPILFRPPFGELDAFGEQAVRDRGLDLILWNVAVNDMKREDAHQMFREITRTLDYKEGGIVLLHDIRFTSVAVLRELLPWLHEHRWNPKRPDRIGYEVVDLPTYLRAVEENPQPYANREELEKAREQRARLRRIKAPAVSDAPGDG